jgi:hypothetical protein
LFVDGRIRFDYGPGNTNLTPTIGISRGNGVDYLLASYDGLATLTNAASIEFGLGPGIFDLGAFEFGGTSSDVVPPVVTSTTPTGVDAQAVVAPPLSQINVTFSEPMNGIDLRAPSNYELRSAGPNGQLGDADDDLRELAVSALVGNTGVSLGVVGGPLLHGRYRLTVLGNDSLHDLAGLSIDGDADGSAGGDYVREYSVARPGDANLDGRVDRADAEIVTRHLGLTGGAAWTDGDFTGEGRVELHDLAIVQQNLDPATSPRISGDADGNGQVDRADLVIVTQNFGITSGATWDQGDFDGDGRVTLADILVVHQQFGQSQSPAPIRAASPSPAHDSTAASRIMQTPVLIGTTTSEPDRRLIAAARRRPRIDAKPADIVFASLPTSAQTLRASRSLNRKNAPI